MTSDSSDVAYCAETMRAADPDRFATAMLIDDRERRAALFAIYAFNLEIARTRESVREIMMGRIRLQWWREVLEECFEGQPRRHQVVQPLAAAIRTFDLPKAPFFAAVDGRETDLDDVPPSHEEALAAYVDATGGGIGHLADRALGGDGEAGARIGRAYAWIGLARALHAHHHAGRHIIPATQLREAPKLEEDASLARFTPEVKRWIKQHVGLAEKELDGLGPGPKAARAVYALASLTRVYCKKLRNADFNPFHPATVSLTPFMRARVLLWFSLFGR